MKQSFSIGFNQYERTAQAYPALLCTLPIFALISVWLPNAMNIATALSSLGFSAAITMLMMQWGRRLGRKIEAEGELGSSVTVAILRHDGEKLSPLVRARYHECFRAHGIVLPTKAEQDHDPQGSDAAFDAAISWLREKTRDEKKFFLIHSENRSYGFRRNLLGLKKIGIAVLIISIIINVTLMIYEGDANGLNEAAAALLLFQIFGCALWIWLVNPAFVRDASQCYGVRLLAACEVLATKEGRVSKSAAKSNPRH
ncbi:hypothetical protein [Novosphingobium jiangmenense]|uniref:Uncharacterized protein n=1 Tax=Novosphingobium jiangmenense TaxID=2791981 RepID=A0ABS0HJT3_9SPHN|nr:hypothetical protein [Novosphingobium jiangmenense]MBF9152520.1 hypothetical protein [Novosphingobium jiangmenense]